MWAANCNTVPLAPPVGLDPVMQVPANVPIQIGGFGVYQLRGT